MHQQIPQITEYHLTNLPDDKEFYYVEDFKNNGFPPFLVQRIQLTLFQELFQSVSMPQTEWADVQDEKTVKSWSRFFDSLKNTARVPSGQVEPLLNQAVTDIVHILVQPRKNIPELLFENEDTLSAEQLVERVKWLVVYPHFGQVLNRYMQRKGEDELTRKRCESIIAQVDEKITRNYTPFQWAEMLQPLFELTNSRVEADLLRLFFEDRQLDEIAKKFTNMDSDMDRDEFIDILIKNQEQAGEAAKARDKEINESESSSSEIQNGEGTLSMDEVEDDELEVPPIEIKSDAQSQSVPDELTYNYEDESEEESNQEIPNIGFKQDVKAQENPEPSSEELDSSGIDTAKEQANKQGKEPGSLNDFFSSDSGPEEEQTTDVKTPEEQTNILSEQEGHSDELPIWQRFADTESNEEDVQENRGLENQETTGERNGLREYLQSHENYFVRALFDGSKQNYLKTLESINEQESWKEAYKLVDHKVFKPNKINIYSEEAVDFTDHLQNYYQKMRG